MVPIATYIWPGLYGNCSNNTFTFSKGHSYQNPGTERLSRLPKIYRLRDFPQGIHSPNQTYLISPRRCRLLPLLGLGALTLEAVPARARPAVGTPGRGAPDRRRPAAGRAAVGPAAAAAGTVDGHERSPACGRGRGRGRGVPRDAAALVVLRRLLWRVGHVHHEGRLVHALRGDDQGLHAARAAPAGAAATAGAPGAGVGAHLDRRLGLLPRGIQSHVRTSPTLKIALCSSNSSLRVVRC